MMRAESDICRTLSNITPGAWAGFKTGARSRHYTTLHSHKRLCHHILPFPFNCSLFVYVDSVFLLSRDFLCFVVCQQCLAFQVSFTVNVRTEYISIKDVSHHFIQMLRKMEHLRHRQMQNWRACCCYTLESINYQRRSNILHVHSCWQRRWKWLRPFSVASFTFFCLYTDTTTPFIPFLPINSWI